MPELSDQDKQQLLRQLPKVDGLVGDDRLEGARRRLGLRTLTDLARAAISEARTWALASGTPPDEEEVLAQVQSKVDAVLGSRARSVINGTGVVLHTNLGRAPLSKAAAEALATTAGGYSNIELELQTGKRGGRGAFAETALAHLSGAAEAHVVNNCAAAVLLMLASLAKGRGVVVSRGELVEIGGSYRVPDVMAASGARMIEVGTTNRTRESDYIRAIEEDGDVAAILRVHQGNFRQVGFVGRPELSALSQVARDHGVHLLMDLGGGAMFDLAPYGLEGEPVVKDCVNAGADVVAFSCDKLLGGPQGGALVGSAELVTRLRKNPLARAVRMGRLPMVALEATMISYLEEDYEAIPAQAAIRRDIDLVRRRVDDWRAMLRDRGIEGETVAIGGAVGGGTLAEEPLDSVALAIATDQPNELASRLRSGMPPVLPRIKDGRLLIDGRTVLPGEDEALLEAIAVAVRSMGRISRPS